MTSARQPTNSPKADLRHLSDDEATARIVELRQAIIRLELLRTRFASELSA